MEKKGKRTRTKFTWELWAVVIIGAIIFALPIHPDYKWLLAIPLYGLFIFLYYRAKKRSS
ncbi:MAG TPA: hypothetical protein PL078_09370 [Bacillota bacterium]|jgi:hypothetical protein|nr:hypothetical protein [Peptococcaceae bacterium MAG4]NLW38071.1 hypothetical protein [Peptococcaceae bacterium]HPZ44197.1 hypothetical protein [Bacillota bacterium]HQD75740.1 hypothetical protein [Bacillota bacterium]HUM58951.1 hypothetical protein [Bacillota bacterium]